MNTGDFNVRVIFAADVHLIIPAALVAMGCEIFNQFTFPAAAFTL